jgi:transcriptional regulator with XRE-family HTH domain
MRLTRSQARVRQGTGGDLVCLGTATHSLHCQSQVALFRPVCCQLPVNARKEEIVTFRRQREASAVVRLLNTYLELRKTTQAQLAKRIGRSQSALSHLMRGGERRDGGPPYLGLKPAKSGEEPILQLVAKELRIPKRALEDALAEDVRVHSLHKLHPDGRKRTSAR